MGLHKIKKLLDNKRNGLQTKEITHRVGENVYQLYIRQRTDNQNIQGTSETKLSKDQQTNKGIGAELREFFQKKKFKQPKNT
jgi:hypothetical protein